MKLKTIILVVVLALSTLVLLAPNVVANPDTCVVDLTATPDKLEYAPGETVTVTVEWVEYHSGLHYFRVWHRDGPTWTYDGQWDTSINSWPVTALTDFSGYPVDSFFTVPSETIDWMGSQWTDDTVHVFQTVQFPAPLTAGTFIYRVSGNWGSYPEADWGLEFYFGSAYDFKIDVVIPKLGVIPSNTYYDDTIWENMFAAPDGLVNGWGSTIFVLPWTGGWLEIECYNGFWVGDWFSVWWVDQNLGALYEIGTTPEVETGSQHAGCPYSLHTGAGNVYSHGLFYVWLPPGTYEFMVRNELFQLLTGARPSACVGPLDGWSPAGYYIGFHRAYPITFDQTGVGSDFTGTVVTIDTVEYGVSALPVSFWWRENSVHTFSFASPLVPLLGKQYVWTSTTGLSTLQSDTLTIIDEGSVTGNYKTQYYLTVKTRPDGVAPVPTPPSGWFDECTTVTLKASLFATKGPYTYAFHYWKINGKFVYSLVASVHMDAPKTAFATYVPDPPGDANLDGLVDITDIHMIAHVYGTRKGDARYNALCDINNDGKINLIDLATAALNIEK